jgi:hypothetical protein
VLRYRKGTSKEMFWETRRDGTWLPGLFGTPTSALPLYREPEVRMAVAVDEPVLLVESESSVDALAGWYATTWAGGASSVQIDRLTSVLGNHPYLLVIPDNDAPRLACLDQLRAAGLAPQVVVPAPGEDARDLYQRIGPDRFAALVSTAVRKSSNCSIPPPELIEGPLHASVGRFGMLVPVGKDRHRRLVDGRPPPPAR